MRRDATRRQMLALVRRWEASSQTQEVFAARHGLSRAKLRYWVRQRACRAAEAEAISFAPVNVVGTTDGDPGAIDVVLTTGERLVVRAGTSAELVRAVVAGLRSTC